MELILISGECRRTVRQSIHNCFMRPSYTICFKEEVCTSNMNMLTFILG